ncbi:MAG: glycosyltransferase family 4 protein [Candidatus Bathyarchaeia archaeon]
MLRGSGGAGLRICLVNTFFPPWRGGAEYFTYGLAKELAKGGDEVAVLCAHHPLSPGTYEVDGIEVIRLRASGWLYGVPIIPGLLGALLSEGSDLIHCNFPNPYNASISALASSLSDTPSILTWHNDLPPVTAAASLLTAFHDNLLSTAYLRRFYRIVATTRRYSIISPILNRFREKVRIVWNGVDCARFRPSIDGGRVRSKFGFEDRKVVLFVGALTKWHGYKGLDILLRALALAKGRDPGIRLLVVGEGHLKPAYMRLASDLGIGGIVAFAGDVSDDELPSYYACSDVLVLPSKDSSEGFGLAILEAGACGKPVIASRVGGLPEVVEDGGNGLLVPPNDEWALSEAILKVLGDEELARGMGKRGRELAEAKDWSKVAGAYRAIYEEALGEG